MKERPATLTSTHCSSEWSLSSTQGVGLGECVSVEEAGRTPAAPLSRPPVLLAGARAPRPSLGRTCLCGTEQTLAAGRGTCTCRRGLPLEAWAPPLPCFLRPWHLMDLLPPDLTATLSSEPLTPAQPSECSCHPCWPCRHGWGWRGLGVPGSLVPQAID